MASASAMDKRTARSQRVTAADLIARYKLEPHPEGGFYAVTHTSANTLTAASASSLPAAFTVFPRPLSSCIYFLLSTSSPLSAFHRLPPEEHWFHHSGRSLRLTTLHADGSQHQTLGSVQQQQRPWLCIPGDTYFAAALTQDAEADSDNDDDFAFVSCLVGGSFFFEEFQLGQREDLLQQFPACAADIMRCTQP